ncbi:MAG: hypothetical protein ACK5NF_05060 [Bacilli bacterium]
MKNTLTITIVYILFSITSVLNYSNYSFDSFNNFKDEYFLSDLNSEKLKKIDDFCNENGIGIISNASTINVDTNKYYVNDVYYDDYYGVFFLNNDVILKNFSELKLKDEYKSIQVKFNNNRELFENFLEDIQVSFTSSSIILEPSQDPLLNYCIILFVVIIFQITFSNIINKYKQFGLKIINGYTKREIFVTEFCKGILRHITILMLSLVLIYVYFTAFKDSILFRGYIEYFFSKILIYYIIFIVSINLINLLIYKFDFKSFLHKGRYSFGLNYVNFTLRSCIIILTLFFVLSSLTYIKGIKQAKNVEDEWEKIKDYSYVVQIYNINKESTEEEEKKAVNEFYDFNIKNHENAFFIEMYGATNDNTFMKNVVFVSKNYFDVIDLGITNMSCGENCINVILSDKYIKDEKNIENRVKGYLQSQCISEYDIKFIYDDIPPIYTYNLEYNIENNNYLNDPIIVVENQKVMTKGFYEVLNSYYSKNTDFESEYYAVESSALEIYNFYKDNNYNKFFYLIVGSVLAIIYLTIISSYSTKYYINSNLKKISILRLNGYSNFDIHYGIYSYLIILYILLAAVAYIITRNDLELFMNYSVYILIFGFLDILYLTYLIIKTEFKEISSLLKGELI